MALRDELKEWRAGAKITQARAAELLGLSLRSVQHIEQGRAYGNETLLRLAIEALKGRGNGA